MSKKKKSGCYHCGSLKHRARSCSTVQCKLCGLVGHGAGGCPSKPQPPVDLGKFRATDCVGAATDDLSDKVNFTYVELFAGMGGFRVALDRLGGRCVFASETDRFCRTVYSQNFGDDRPAGDITRIPSDQVPDHDLLVGGFPCQPFSSSGSREGMKDPKGRLYREICRIVKAKQPKFFLLENVRGLLLHDDGDTLRTISCELHDCGYVVQHQLLDAVNLLPQERCRLYLVGIRNDIAKDERPYVFPALPNLSRGVQDILHSTKGVDLLSPEDMKKLLLSEHQVNKIRSQKYTQLHPEARFLVDMSQPAKTLQSSYSNYMVGSQFVITETGYRRFSSREAARLQGFPESFRLCPQRAYHMIGNAVAPPLVAMIAAPLVQNAAQDNVANICGWLIARELLVEASPNDGRREAMERKLEHAELH